MPCLFGASTYPNIARFSLRDLLLAAPLASLTKFSPPAAENFATPLAAKPGNTVYFASFDLADHSDILSAYDFSLPGSPRFLFNQPVPYCLPFLPAQALTPLPAFSAKLTPILPPAMPNLLAAYIPPYNIPNKINKFIPRCIAPFFKSIPALA